MNKNPWIWGPRRRALTLAGGLLGLCGLLGGCGLPEDAAKADEAGGVALQALSTQAARLTLSASELVFRERCPGERGTKSIELRSTGSSSVTIRSLSVSGRAFSLYVPPRLPAELEPGERLTLTLRFSPPLNDDELEPTGTLTINSNNSGDSSIEVPLSGTVSPMQFEFSPSRVDFETIRLGAVRARNLTLRNTGACALEIGGIDQTGSLSDAIMVGDLGDTPIGAGDEREVEIIAQCLEVGGISVRVRFFSPLNQSMGTARVVGECRR